MNRPMMRTHVDSDVDFSSRYRYETFRSLLKKNSTVLQLMADLEVDLNFNRQGGRGIHRPARELLDTTLLMAEELNILTADRHRKLYAVLENLSQRIRKELEREAEIDEAPLAMRVSAEPADARLVGGKAAGLAALMQVYPAMTPPAFVITSKAYRLLIEENRLEENLRLLMKDLEVVTDIDAFTSRTHALRNLFLEARVPKTVSGLITAQASELDRSGDVRWAVRSSATCEDQELSFAGQFDSALDVSTGHLEQAYKQVVASCFSDRAVRYRFANGIREADIQMAVLFMPMVDADFSGVIYTDDPVSTNDSQMLINAVPGLAQQMTQGAQPADIYRLEKSDTFRLIESVAAIDSQNGLPVYERKLPETALRQIVDTSRELCLRFGHEMDIEWSLTQDGRMWLLQGRQLQVHAKKRHRPPDKKAVADIEGGITIFPGRAEGPVEHISDEQSPVIQQKGAVAVARSAAPQLAKILPHLGALIVETGNPVGHLATLAREQSVPCLFRVGSGIWRFKPGTVVSVDATHRRIYRGSRWPEVRERMRTRLLAEKVHRSPDPLYHLLLALNLTDPYSSGFKAKKCLSIHDVIRFIHEMAVRSMFDFGDRQNRPWKSRAIGIETPIPIKIKLLDLDGSIAHRGKTAQPQEIDSVPFGALWRGVSDPRVLWQPRTLRAMDLMPSDFEERVMGGEKGPRRRRATNYLILAQDYLNFNARFAYHYAMIDAVVGPWPENNHVNFRMRGGGGGDAGRIRRASFIERVMRHYGFGVDRRKDLITAWFRYHSQQASEEVLEMLGRLMACGRQLDMLLTGDEMVKRYADQFLNENYRAFA